MKNFVNTLTRFIITARFSFALRSYPSVPFSPPGDHVIKSKPLFRASKAHRKVTTIDKTTEPQLHIPLEYHGDWVGDEKFIFNGTVFPYCSQCSVVVDEVDGVQALLWISAKGFCMDIGVNTVTGDITGKWFQEIVPNEIYFYKVMESECLPESECTGDVLPPDDTGSFDFSNYQVTAKACGRILAQELSRDVLSCKMWQTEILTPSSGGESIVIITQTYGPDSGDCPPRTVYTSDELLTESNIMGSALMVLQSTFVDEETGVERNLTDPCTWACYDKTNCPS